MARAEQQELRFPNTWGGRRRGAGRPNGSRRSSRMPHTARPRVSCHRPHHITVRVTRGTWNLRSQRGFSTVRRALELAHTARLLNRVMGAQGRRLDDRYHEHVLGTPREVRNAVYYVLGNRARHLARRGIDVQRYAADPFSSVAEPMVKRPRSWLLREGWTRAEPP